MKRIVILFLLFVSFQLFADKPRIAILDFEDNSGTLSKKLSKQQLIAERKLLSIFFRKYASEKFIVIADKAQEEIIKKMKKESHRLDRNEVYKIAAGMGVSADKILYTTIEPFGRKYTVMSELIDLEREISDEQGMVGTADFDGTQESLREALRKIVDQFMGRDEEIVAAHPKKSDDQLACEKARSLREPAGWIAYKNRYPDGICMEEADKELDRMGCELAKNRNTIEDWEGYLKRHPSGICSFDAETAILKLKRKDNSQNNKNSQSNQVIISNSDNTQSLKPDSAIKEALSFYANGDLKAALDSLENSNDNNNVKKLRENISKISKFINRAKTDIKDKEYEEAIRTIAKAEKLDEDILEMGSSSKYRVYRKHTVERIIYSDPTEKDLQIFDTIHQKFKRQREELRKELNDSQRKRRDAERIYEKGIEAIDKEELEQLRAEFKKEYKVAKSREVVDVKGSDDIYKLKAEAFAKSGLVKLNENDLIGARRAFAEALRIDRNNQIALDGMNSINKVVAKSMYWEAYGKRETDKAKAKEIFTLLTKTLMPSHEFFLKAKVALEELQ